MKNEKEALALMKRYETITLEEIEKAFEDVENHIHTSPKLIRIVAISLVILLIAFLVLLINLNLKKRKSIPWDVTNSFSNTLLPL